jgi:hypothetical protein
MDVGVLGERGNEVFHRRECCGNITHLDLGDDEIFVDLQRLRLATDEILEQENRVPLAAGHDQDVSQDEARVRIIRGRL